MGEPLRRPVQRDPPEEEDGQDKIGEEGSEVNHLETHPQLFSHDVLKQNISYVSHIIFRIYDIDLSRGGNALAKYGIDDQPRDDETNEVPVLDPNKVLCKSQIGE